MFCTNCGKELPDDAQFCPACGMSVKGAPASATQTEAPQGEAGTYQPINNDAQYYQSQGYNGPVNNSVPQDHSSFGFAALCFFFPIVGLILFLVWHDQQPLKAKSCGIGALVSVGLGIVLFIITMILVGGSGTYEYDYSMRLLLSLLG